jgi:hypothetical protein
MQGLALIPFLTLTAQIAWPLMCCIYTLRLTKRLLHCGMSV